MGRNPGIAPQGAGVGDREIKSIGQAIHGGEHETHVNSFAQRLVAYARGAGSKGIVPADFARGERQLFDELKRGPQARTDFSSPPIGNRCLDCFRVAQRLRRDRGVADRSKAAMVQAGDQRGKNLDLAHGPLFHSAKAFLYAPRQVPAAWISPVRERQDGAWNAAAPQIRQKKPKPLAEMHGTRE
jgi:hypothetical protein